MAKLTQEYILSIVFSQSIEREELLLKKYKDYSISLKDTELIDILDEFKQNSHEHIKMLNDKMLKLNIQA